ncbi:MAG: VOC family protein [Pseudomonadales bacterium]
MSESVPFQLERIDHVVLRARNSDALVSFYRDVLGCPVEREAVDLGLVQLRAGASLIDVIAVDGPLGRAGGAAPRSAGAQNLDHVCLRVSPFEPAVLSAHLRRHGAEPSAVRHVYGAEGRGPSIYVDDPEGNTVELKGPAEPGSRIG